MSGAKLSDMAAGVLLLMLAGCGADKAEPVAPAEASVPETGGLVSGAVDTTLTGTLWNGGKARPLAIEAVHPDGVVLQLTSLQSRADETVMGMRVTNGHSRAVLLNNTVSSREGYILLETGERLYLSPPPANPGLSMPPGKVYEGELVFLGHLPRLQSAVLVLNDGNREGSAQTDTPGFRIDLPLSTLANSRADQGIPAPVAAPDPGAFARGGH